MIKFLKIIGILILILIIFISFLVFKFITAEPEIMTPIDYETIVDTGGDIESKYLAHGENDVAYFEKEIDEEWKKYGIYYPVDIENNNKKYPVIVMTNGSGVWWSRYFASFEHFASWGFIVIGNEHNTSFAGDSSDASLEYLIAENDTINSIFYQKIDLDNVGIAGHSQGGVGVFNAITNQPHGDVYKTAVSISPVWEDTAKAINWTYYPNKINIPIMIVAGTNNDTISLEDLQKLYSNIKSSNIKIMGLRSNTNHSEMLYSADGYITAWFMYRLQGDEEAGTALLGDNPEILTNPNWEEVNTSS